MFRRVAAIVPRVRVRSCATKTEREQVMEAKNQALGAARAQVQTTAEDVPTFQHRQGFQQSMRAATAVLSVAGAGFMILGVDYGEQEHVFSGVCVPLCAQLF
eukprot:TRINITY_DN3980_c0_g1_i2.p1 TRINITY_DN3980_c0_g1~~TRINITY_DN3980_c0_g1_i2.p1  ORF type:complete len:102 (+),score=25.46 TRINITY_DN3980_c0_g1_i2:45-350(+)